MSKFKKGDKVRIKQESECLVSYTSTCLPRNNAGKRDMCGNICEISSVCENDDLQIWDVKKQFTYYFEPHWVELVDENQLIAEPSKFRVGDCVIITNKKADNDTGFDCHENYKRANGKVGYITEIGGTNKPHKLNTKKNDWGDYLGWYDSDEIELYKEGVEVAISSTTEVNINNNENKNMNNILKRLKDVIMDEPAKSLLKYGVTNSNGDLTQEGQEVFIDWLFKQNRDEFVKDVIEVLKKADKDEKKKD